MPGPLALRTTRWLFLVAVSLCTPGIIPARPPFVDEIQPLTGQPIELAVIPSVITLSGPRDVRQLLVTGKYADGSIRDLTWAVSVDAATPGIVVVDEGQFLRGLKDGTTTLRFKAGGKETTAQVSVTNYDQRIPVSFRHDVIAAFNVGGCNSGACHGTPSGKNGFKLSLRGSDPGADYLQLTRDQFGRRSDAHNPTTSLILLKALGRIPHEGGTRFAPGNYPAEAIATWLAQGSTDDPSNLPPVKSLTVMGGSRVLLAPARWQQLAIVASFADGKSRDVTRITNFSSSDPGIADVSSTGLVDFKRPGEVAILIRYLEEMISVRLTYLEPKNDFTWSKPAENNFIDRHVFAKLKQMTIQPSQLCTDQEFVRRIHLDVVGRLPTIAESRAFVADKERNKRDRLIERLVTLPEFSDFWAMKWSDVLRSSRKSIQLKGSHAFQLWLRDRISENAPLDEIVTELLTASGNTFSNPPANYFRIAKDPQSLAETTAQLFLGVRMQCAKCHNHPFERWTQDDYYGLSAVFARVKTKPDPAGPAKPAPNTPSAEIVLSTRDGEVNQPRTGKVMKPRFPGSGEQDVKAGVDRREVFAEWLTRPDNPFFARSVANRVWFHLMGKGIVDPVDDFRESNPASNDELLDAIAQDFAENGFDLRHLIMTILKSRTYQLSAEVNESNRDDSRYFSHAVTKLLTAEQLLDALCDVTAVPEKFTGLPPGTRAIQLPDGEVNHPFLKTFGQPARELACECERESDGNLAQALQLINGPTVNEKVRNPNNRLGLLLTAKKPEVELLEQLYFSALSRAPDAEERRIALAHVAKSKDSRKAWEDVLWAIINTREFLFRH